ncbi:hypothetical protein B0T20DRAFT_343360 [Sordaria brevicollis]|uniref:Thioesterase domain-containing protein n=1 Tax=Sordaria brevicollis TaxID=83679 RepID=A0AAE0PMI5_SORBR|nr:hypothetical protein B0T20DRAFT_343360 [Sordaria brevicollis]
MFRQNPNLIQPPSPHSSSPPPTPLFLLHDGGGTIFSYYCLSDLSRPVYGIFNPHFSTKSTFKGGIPEMARLYLSYIIETLYGDDQCGGVISNPKPARTAHATGKEQERDLILGGWSLGGMVSLEVAKQVQDFNVTQVQLSRETGCKPRRINVKGVVMIDSMNPRQRDFPREVKVASPNATTMQWGRHTREETKEAVLRCFEEARRMLGGWELPTGQPENTGPSGTHAADGPEKHKQGHGPPPVVLLKCRENVPLTQEQRDAGEVSRTDVHRKDRTLGWGKYDAGMVRKVIEVDGNHFNLFTDPARAEVVTKGVKEACEFLERLWEDGKS